MQAITDYIARRMIEREHALTASPAPAATIEAPPPSRARGIWTFVLGVVVGVVALLGIAAFMALRGG